MYTIAINGSSMTFLLFIYNIHIILTSDTDRLIDELRPVDLALFTLLLELVNLSFTVNKCHTEFWGNLWRCTTPHI